MNAGMTYRIGMRIKDLGERIGCAAMQRLGLKIRDYALNMRCCHE